VKDTHCELSHTSLECNIRGSGVKAAMSKDEDRAKGDSDTQGAKSDSVKRQLTGEDAPEEANPESLVGPTGGKEGKEPPAGVGESVARRGEDMIQHHGRRLDATTRAPMIPKLSVRPANQRSAIAVE